MPRLYLAFTVLISILTLPATAGEVDTKAVLGGAIGGAAGAAIGSSVGGREGAIIGGALGGAAGAAVGSSQQPQPIAAPRIVQPYPGHAGFRERHDNGRHLGHYKSRHRRHDDD